MLNIGLVELLIIIFFSLIFIKPEDLPKIGKYIGLFYRKINLYILNLKYELSSLDVLDSKKKKQVKKRNTKD